MGRDKHLEEKNNQWSKILEEAERVEQIPPFVWEDI